MKKSHFKQLVVVLWLAIVLPGRLCAQSAPIISYSSPQTYTAGAAIPPLTPTSSRVSAPAYSSAATLGSGYNDVGGVAIDGAGNIYVADFGNNNVWKIPPGGGSPVTIGSGFDGPEGLAVDAAGNVYVWTVNQPEVHVSSDIAWITYVNRGSIKDASGTKDVTWLESAVLRKERGDWRIQFFHSTRVPEKK